MASIRIITIEALINQGSTTVSPHQTLIIVYNHIPYQTRIPTYMQYSGLLHEDQTKEHIPPHITIQIERFS